MNDAEFAVGALCTLGILGLCVWIGVVLYFAYTRMDEVLEHLKNGTAIKNRLPLCDGGPIGKLLLIGGI